MAAMFDGKVALVTGAGSGIGRASALAFAKEGARVVVADFVVPGGEETCRLITEAGGQATFVKVDVRRAAEVQAMVAQAVAAFGRLDFAHNNAGVALTGSVAESTEETWDTVLGVNLKGIWLAMKYEIPELLKVGGGALVNTASVAGMVGAPGAAAYSASKGGVINLTRTAALELAKQNIRVNCIAPGYIRTPMVVTPETEKAVGEVAANVMPIGRMGEPREIADAAVWLCSDKASLVTGHCLVVDGGWTAQ